MTHIPVDGPLGYRVGIYHDQAGAIAFPSGAKGANGIFSLLGTQRNFNLTLKR